MYRILFVILIFLIFIPLVWNLMNWLDKKIDKALNKEEMKMKDVKDVIDEVNDAKQKLEDKEQEIKEMQKANDSERDALKIFLNQKDND